MAMTGPASPDDAYDVAVVGYGPTGLALAAWLGRAGHRTVVIERWPHLYQLPRAGHVDAEVMRLFQKLGVAETIAASSSIARHTMVRDANGDLLGTLPAEESDQGWASHYSLFQPELEQTLDTLVRARGNVTVLQGWQAQSFDVESSGSVRIGIASGDDHEGRWVPSGETAELTARWLIGADGANSCVRDLVTGPVDDLGYQARALVIFAERLDPAVGSAMPDSEICMVPSRPYVAFRESGRRFARWEFRVNADETTAEMSEAAMAWRMIRPWGFTPENSRLVRHTVFEFKTLVSRGWRTGNVLLAGDAAHVMPPFQGQGMCSGQRDAAALAWRLDLVLRGISDAALLDSYGAERRPHVTELTRSASERGQQFWLTDPDQAKARDEILRRRLGENLSTGYGAVPALTDGVLMKRGEAVVAPAGQLSAQFAVRHSGREALLDDVMEPGWLLVVRDTSFTAALDRRHRDVLDRLGVRTWALDNTDEGTAPVDHEHSYAQWLESLACGGALIRPDSYVFGTAAHSDDLGSLVDSLAEQLRLRESSR